MFEKLIDIIGYNKKKNKVPQEIKKDDNNEIILTKNGDVLKMSILGHPTTHLFFEEVNKLPQEDQRIILKLPLSILVNSSQQVNSGNYIWTTIENKKYIIMSNSDSIIINQSKELDDCIKERSLSIDMKTNGFIIYSATHDNNYSTQEHKSFNINNYEQISQFFELSPEEAKEECELLFNDLIHEEKILNELEGIIKIEDTKFIIDSRFSYLIPNSQHKIMTLKK